jgi:hypothetical protein
MNDPSAPVAPSDLIRKLARQNGWISPQDRERLQGEEWGRDLLESVDGARNIACKSTEA